MAEPDTDIERKVDNSENETIIHVLDSVGWGLFFMWVGIALLLDIGWGLGLIGVGTITLGEQGARWYYGLRLESFWIVVGAVFALGGAWELLNIQFAVAPILFIIAGAALLFSALRHW